jgi:hypothetical protein
MKLIKSKKGDMTSVISDVFALLAYFIFFIIIIILITNTGTQARTEVEVQKIRIDYNVALLNGLKTPIELGFPEGNRTITFADYLSETADAPECDPNKGITITKTILDNYEIVFDNVTQQMNPYFGQLLKMESCMTIKILNASKCDIYDATIYQIGLKEDCYETRGQKKTVAEIKFPTRDRKIVEVALRTSNPWAVVHIK